jgi:hypothetical protein
MLDPLQIKTAPAGDTDEFLILAETSAGRRGNSLARR